MKGFSYPYNPEIHAAARGTGLNVSPKAAREVCHAIKGMELEKAKSYLERVMDLEQAVPFKRHDGKVGHRKGKGMSSGRFPVKTAAAILKVIESAGNNGEALHIDIEILPEMIGLYFGELAPTRTSPTHTGPGVGATKSSKFMPLK